MRALVMEGRLTCRESGVMAEATGKLASTRVARDRLAVLS